MATARKAPVRRATQVAARPAARRAPAAKTDATRAVPNGALNGHTRPARAKSADAAQPEAAMAAADAVRKVRASEVAADGADGVVRPAYWDKACADLVKRDRILKKLIPKFGPAHLVKRGDPFVTLARSVVGQQISVRAAQTIWERVESACAKLAPQQFIRLGHEKLQACGLSKRKSEYILDLAKHFVSGALHVDAWTSMEDEAVIEPLETIIAAWLETHA